MISEEKKEVWKFYKIGRKTKWRKLENKGLEVKTKWKRWTEGDNIKKATCSLGQSHEEYGKLKWKRDQWRGGGKKSKGKKKKEKDIRKKR